MGNKHSRASDEPTAVPSGLPAQHEEPETVLPQINYSSSFRSMHVSSLPHFVVADADWAESLRDARTATLQEQEDMDSDRLTQLTQEINEHYERDRKIAWLQSQRLRFLCNHLPLELKERWTLVFASPVHGASFRRFQHFIVNAGEVIVIVRTTGGRIFGGRCENFDVPLAPSWRAPKSGQPHFVFCLGHDSDRPQQQQNQQEYEDVQQRGTAVVDPPSWHVWRPTGYNDHFQYLNSETETLYNGFGMGGQLDFFALAIDDSFDTGHCRGEPTSTTFGNLPLNRFTGEDKPLANDDAEAADKVLGGFAIDHVEVWSMADAELTEYDLERERDRRGLDSGKGSILRTEDNADKVIKGYLFDFAAQHLGAGGTAEQNVDETGEVLLIQ